MCNAYDYYEGVQDKDFDYYEHLGSVRPPASWKKSDKTKFNMTDSTVGSLFDNSFAVEILQSLG
ncbi:MAG: hypothetical protein ACKPKO_61570, partial [Candidatus Fonsibacter sp.]